MLTRVTDAVMVGGAADRQQPARSRYRRQRSVSGVGLRVSLRVMGHNSRDELRRIAEETFGWARLYPEQLEAMEQVMAGHDVLAVLPTGAGKRSTRCRR